MNDESKTPSDRERLEERVIALLLGELDADGVQAVMSSLEGDAALREFHGRMRATLGLVGEASHTPDLEKEPVPQQLSKERREALLAKFKVVPMPAKKRKQTPWLSLAAAVAVMLVLGGLFMPSLSRVKSHATRLGRLDVTDSTVMDEAEETLAESQPAEVWAFIADADGDSETVNGLVGDKYAHMEIVLPATKPAAKEDTAELILAGRMLASHVNDYSGEKATTVDSYGFSVFGRNDVEFSVPARFLNSDLTVAPRAAGATRELREQSALEADAQVVNSSSVSSLEVKLMPPPVAQPEPTPGGNASGGMEDARQSVRFKQIGRGFQVGAAADPTPATGAPAELVNGRRSGSVEVIALQRSNEEMVAQQLEQLMPAGGGRHVVLSKALPQIGQTLDRESVESFGTVQDKEIHESLAAKRRELGEPRFGADLQAIAEGAPVYFEYSKKENAPAAAGALAPSEAKTPEVEHRRFYRFQDAPAAGFADALGRNDVEKAKALPALNGQSRADVSRRDQLRRAGGSLVVAGRSEATMESGSNRDSKAKDAGGLLSYFDGDEKKASAKAVRGSDSEMAFSGSGPSSGRQSNLSSARPVGEAGQTPGGMQRRNAKLDSKDLDVVKLWADGSLDDVEAMEAQERGRPTVTALGNKPGNPIAAPVPAEAELKATQLSARVKRKAPTTLTPKPEMATRENAYSTFSLNVSDVAFKLAKASLDTGTLPDAETIRSEEFLNAFNYHDPAPVGNQRVSLAWNRARNPFAHDRDLLRFSVQTAARGRAAAQPLNLVLLLDASGSMERADRERIVQEMLGVLVKQLQPSDRISVVAFARTARLLIDGMAGGQPDKVLQRVAELTPEGGTNIEAALETAYEIARRHYLENGNNRVILLTDGAANLGDVNPATLRARVEAERKGGVALDCFGVGWEGYNDDLLESLSRNGDGRYGFINDPAEARDGFANLLAGALQVAAADVKAQVEFNPARVTAWRQIGYDKHQLTKEQFRDNTVDAAEIGAAESGTALYSIQVNRRGVGPLGVVRVRFRIPSTGEYVEEQWELECNPADLPLESAGPAMRLATVASGFAEWLAANPSAGDVTLPALERLLAGVPEVFANDERPRELRQMIAQARTVAGE